MPKKKSIKIILFIILVWSILITTDCVRAAMKKSPIFAYPIVMHKDGGSKECYGIGYKVNVYVSEDIEHFSEIVRVDIGTWLMPFEK